MKKILSIVGIAAMVIGLQAASANDIVAALSNKNYSEVIKLCDTAMETAKNGQNNWEKFCPASYKVYAQIRTGALKTTAEAFAALEKNCDAVNYTGNRDGAKVFICWLFEDFAQGAKIGQSSTDKNAIYRAALCLGRLKRYQEAADLAIKSGLIYSYNVAAGYSRQAGNLEKMYEYALLGFNRGAFTKVEIAKKMVNWILEADFSGTAITSSKIKEFLQTVNRRCSRFLKPGNPTAWDEVIQLVRQTLETY